MSDRFTMVQQNIHTCGNPESKNKTYSEKLMNTLLVKDPDILFFSEFRYDRYEKTIIERLEARGFQIIFPLAFDENNNSHKNSPCVCMLTIKKNKLRFEPEKKQRYPIETDLRYIEGTLTHKDKEIHLFLTHVPPGGTNQKASMLFGAFFFWQQYRNQYAMIAGDLNTETNNSTVMEYIFKMFYPETVDTTEHEPTYKFRVKKDGIEEEQEKCLDYALVSASMRRDMHCRTTLLETVSDHKALVTTFDL